MATRKQKHAAAMEKRERFMAELKRTGLAAQAKDIARREAKKAKEEQERLDKILEAEAKRISDHRARNFSRIHHASDAVSV